MTTPRRVAPARPARAVLLTAAALALAATALSSSAHAQPRPERRDTTAAAQEYTILIYESDAQLAARTSPSAGDAYWTAYDRFAGELAGRACCAAARRSTSACGRRSAAPARPTARCRARASAGTS
jgi:hypothetical protein